MKEVKSPKKPLFYYYGIVLLIIIVFNVALTPMLTKQWSKWTMERLCQRSRQKDR